MSRPAPFRSTPFRPGRPALAALLAAVAALPLAFAQGDAAASPEARLELLVERVAGGWGDPSVATEVLPGALPADLSFEPAATDDALLLGSIERRRDGALVNAQAFWDAPGSPAAALAALRASLLEAGFAAAPGWDPTGIQPAEPDAGAQLCREDTVVWAHAMAAADGGVDLRFDATFTPDAPPCPLEGETTPPWPQAPLPLLRVPAGATATIHGGAVQADQASTSAVVEGAGLPAIYARFDEQLREAGWDVTADGVGLTRWRLADDEGRAWAGTLVLASAGDGRTWASFVVLEEGRG